MLAALNWLSLSVYLPTKIAVQFQRAILVFIHMNESTAETLVITPGRGQIRVAIPVPIAQASVCVRSSKSGSGSSRPGAKLARHPHG